jgi:hypothetical protein
MVFLMFCGQYTRGCSVEKTEENTSFSRPGYRRKGKIKINLKWRETLCTGLVWFRIGPVAGSCKCGKG